MEVYRHFHKRGFSYDPETAPRLWNACRIITASYSSRCVPDPKATGVLRAGCTHGTLGNKNNKKKKNTSA